MKKTIISLLIITAFSTLLGFFYAFHLPEFKIWAIERIQKYTQDKTPVRVLVSNIDFNIFPIGISLRDIRITPQRELANAIDKAFIKEARLSINPFSFLTGLFQFSKIEIIEPQISVKNILALKNLKKGESKDSPLDLKSILQFPLNGFVIHRMNLNISPQENVPEIHLNDFSLEIENQKTSALISFITPHLTVMDPKIADIPADISIGSRILIQDNQILVSALKIKKGESYILASGYTQTPLTKIKFDEVSLKIKTHIVLDQLKSDLEPFLKKVQLPKMEGLFESQTEIVKNPQETGTIETKLHFKNLKIDQFVIGSIVSQFFYKNDVILSPLIQVQNSSGKAQIKDLQANIKGDRSFKFNVVTDDVQLQELLKNLGLGQLDLLLTINTNLACAGQYKQADSFVKCQGDATPTGLRVYNPQTDIVKFEKGHIKGNLYLNKTQINLEADLDLGKNSHGHAKGYVNYDKGFHFEYTAPHIDLQDAQIAHLDLRGTGENLSGETNGDSHKATFSIDSGFKDFYIKKYFLGNPGANVFYKDGVLKIKDIIGLLRTSKYTGNLTVNFRNETTIQGSMKSGYLELSDLQKAFAEIVELPVEFYGSGEASADFSGPLDFSTLSYTLKSHFINGNVANESYDDAFFDVTSHNGHVKADRAVVKKSGATLTMTGTAEPNGQIQTQWVGSNFTLQTFNNFSKTDVDIDGDLNFKLSLTDYILKPKSLLTGTLTHTRISQEKISDSKFSLSFGKNTIEGSGAIFGDKIKGNFVIPLAPDAPFSVNAKIDKWDFIPLIYLISSKSRAQEFTTLLTGNVQLASNQNGLWGANGTIQVDQLNVQRGIKGFQISDPFTAQFNQGHAEIKKFQIRGDNTSLDVSSQKNSKYPISLFLNGKIDLNLISFLTPFLDDLKGILAVTTQLSFGPKEWGFIGSGFVTQGYIRTDALPHTFDNIDADLLFNDDQIIINKMTCDFANGKISGDGSVEILGTNNLKTDVEGKFNNITLRVPKDVLSKGSGDFRLTGNWFPYTLQGSYLIQSGLFAKDLGEEDKQKGDYTRRQLLPNSLTKKNYEPLLFDFDLIFNRGIDIRNDLVQSKAYGKLHMKGPPSQPIFTGQVQLQRNGKIYFKDTVFEIETGDLKFNDLTKTNPDIYLSANSQVEENIDGHAQRYDINLLLQGKPDKYTINLTSNPPRDQKDIISLLTVGFSSETNATLLSQPQTTTLQTQSNAETNAQITRQSYGAGASLLTKNKFSRNLQDKTGIQFNVGTTFDETTQTTAPQITISKQWTPKITTSTSRTFGDLTTQDVKVEYQLNKNLSLVGSWEVHQISGAYTNSATTPLLIDQNNPDVLGLDLEYKFEYK